MLSHVIHYFNIKNIADGRLIYLSSQISMQPPMIIEFLSRHLISYTCDKFHQPNILPIDLGGARPRARHPVVKLRGKSVGYRD